MLDVRKLRALREVALRGTFSEAAQRLNYSQSAVSQQIAQLERQVGVQLLERRGRSVSLTPAGRALVERTDVILVELRQAQAELDAAAGTLRNSLRLAVPSPSMATWLPAAVQALQRRYPDLRLKLSIAGPYDAVETVEAGDADIGVIAGSARTADVAVQHLLDEELLVALPTRHPLAARQAVSLDDLADEHWVLPVGADGELVVDACRRAGFGPRVAVRTDDALAAQGLVSAGVGPAVLGALASSLGRRDEITMHQVGLTRWLSTVTADPPSGMIEVAVREMRRAADAWLAGADTGVPDPPARLRAGSSDRPVHLAAFAARRTADELVVGA